jgi:DNA invertase Pin-like site-specific DNA recombinase
MQMRESTGLTLTALPALTPQQQDEARQRRAEGATLTEQARSYDVSKATTSRITICA